MNASSTQPNPAMQHAARCYLPEACSSTPAVIAASLSHIHLQQLRQQICYQSSVDLSGHAAATVGARCRCQAAVALTAPTLQHGRGSMQSCSAVTCHAYHSVNLAGRPAIYLDHCHQASPASQRAFCLALLSCSCSIALFV